MKGAINVGRKLKASAQEAGKAYNAELMILCASVLFGLAMSFVRIIRDDVGHVARLDTVADCAQYVADLYFHWSSRIFVNFVWLVALVKGRILIFALMAVSMYVFLKAILLLFAREQDTESVIFVIGVAMLFPWGILTTAGWMATAGTYFCPLAFGLMSLVPIKKVLDNERMRRREMVLYAFCLVYGSNNEQMCVVLLALYAIAAAYFLAVRRFNWAIGLQLAICVASMAFTMTCPGNWSRDVSEEITWFPTYGMLGNIDKAEIGLSTTLKWIFAGSNLFIIALCVLMTYFVWKKYSQPLFRLIAMIPSAIVIMAGPLKDVTAKALPYASYLANDVGYYGAFDVAAKGGGIGAVQFGIFLAAAVCVCIEMMLLNDTAEGFIVDISLAAMGVASRCMMGFSPTVYASSTRTYAPMIFCMMALLVHVYETNAHLLGDSEGRARAAIRYSSCLSALLGFANLVFLVVSA